MDLVQSRGALNRFVCSARCIFEVERRDDVRGELGLGVQRFGFQIDSCYWLRGGGILVISAAGYECRGRRRGGMGRELRLGGVGLGYRRVGFPVGEGKATRDSWRLRGGGYQGFFRVGDGVCVREGEGHG